MGSSFHALLLAGGGLRVSSLGGSGNSFHGGSSGDGDGSLLVSSSLPDDGCGGNGSPVSAVGFGGGTGRAVHARSCRCEDINAARRARRCGFGSRAQLENWARAWRWCAARRDRVDADSSPWARTRVERSRRTRVNWLSAIVTCKRVMELSRDSRIRQYKCKVYFLLLFRVLAGAKRLSLKACRGLGTFLHSVIE
jgi:hypothetical protein